MQPDFAHYSVHDECGPCHIAGVFKKSDKEKKEKYLREKRDHGPDARNRSIDKKVTKVASRHRLQYLRVYPVDPFADHEHRNVSPRKDCLEHNGHQSNEDDESPYFVRKHLIYLIARRIRISPLSNDRRTANTFDPFIARFNYDRIPVDAELLQYQAVFFYLVE